MSDFLKKFLLSCSALLVLFPGVSLAVTTATSTPLTPRERLNVEPSVIDEQAKIRDILEYTVKIVNKSDQQQEFYAIVNDIVSGQEPVYKDAHEAENNKLSEWIEIQRSQVSLQPGKSIEMPLKIDVNLYALPGKRHAVIDFVSASNFYEAAKLAKLYDNPRTLINIDVTEDIIEKAKLDQFVAAKNIFLDGLASFNLELSNSGNRDIAPQGQLFVYNRRNQEIARLPFGGGAAIVEAGTNKQFLIDWRDDRAFGKFKAKVELEYGSSTKRDLQDVAYFWMLPKRYLIIFGTLVFLFLVTVRLGGRRKRRATRIAIVDPRKPKSTDTILNLKDR